MENAKKRAKTQEAAKRYNQGKTTVKDNERWTKDRERNSLNRKQAAERRILGNSTDRDKQQWAKNNTKMRIKCAAEAYQLK